MSAGKSQQAVAAKVRARYGRFFTYEDYADLCSASGIPEFVSLLHDHPDFADLFGERATTPDREQIELRLRYGFYSDLSTLFRFDLFLGSELYRVVSEYLTTDLILSFARRLNAGTLQGFLPEVPSFLRSHLGFDLDELCAAETYSNLLAVFAGHPYLPALGANLPQENQPVDLTALEFSLKEIYYQRMQKLFLSDKTGFADAAKLVAMHIDVLNLQRLLRTKRYFSAVKTPVSFFSGGTIAPKKLSALAELPLDVLEKEVRKTTYGRYLKQDLPVDVALKAVLFEQCRKTIRFQVEVPSLLISYLYLSLNRLDCLTTVAEGVRYQMAPDTIMNLLPIVKR